MNMDQATEIVSAAANTMEPQVAEAIAHIVTAWSDKYDALYIQNKEITEIVLHDTHEDFASRLEVKRLREALAYYADKEHYEPYCIEGEGCDVTEDEGYIARAALAGESDA